MLPILDGKSENRKKKRKIRDIRGRDAGLNMQRRVVGSVAVMGLLRGRWQRGQDTRAGHHIWPLMSTLLKATFFESSNSEPALPERKAM